MAPWPGPQQPWDWPSRAGVVLQGVPKKWSAPCVSETFRCGGGPINIRSRATVTERQSCARMLNKSSSQGLATMLQQRANWGSRTCDLKAEAAELHDQIIFVQSSATQLPTRHRTGTLSAGSAPCASSTDPGQSRDPCTGRKSGAGAFPRPSLEVALSNVAQPGLPVEQDQLVSALSKCYMRWFLAFAVRQKFTVEGYFDKPTGTWTRDCLGRNVLLQVRLRPRVYFSGSRKPSPAQLANLRDEAYRNAILANGVRIPVHCVHEPQLQLAKNKSPDAETATCRYSAG